MTAITDEATVSSGSGFSFDEKFHVDENREPILLYCRNITATVPVNQTDCA